MLFPVKRSTEFIFVSLIDANEERVEVEDLVNAANGLSQALKDQFKTTRALRKENATSPQLVALATALERGKTADREIEALSEQARQLRVQNDILRHEIEGLKERLEHVDFQEEKEKSKIMSEENETRQDERFYGQWKIARDAFGALKISEELPSPVGAGHAVKIPAMETQMVVNRHNLIHIALHVKLKTSKRKLARSKARVQSWMKKVAAMEFTMITGFRNINKANRADSDSQDETIKSLRHERDAAIKARDYAIDNAALDRMKEARDDAVEALDVRTAAYRNTCMLKDSLKREITALKTRLDEVILAANGEK